MGQKGRMARRPRNAVTPVTTTDKFFLRARRAKARSMRENQVVPSRGQQNAAATAITVRQASISISEGPVSEPGARFINESPTYYLPAGRLTSRTVQPAGFSGIITTVPAGAASKRA